jgi:IS5 family transposase
MAIKHTFQSSLLALAYSQKKLRCEKFLDEMNTVIPWSSFCSLIEPFYEEKKTGRPRTDLLLLLRIHFLQQWYNLSDPMVEEWIYDRISFQKFLGIDLLAVSVPDETTILNFRHLLEEQRLSEKFFETVRNILEQKNIIMKKGSIVDATIIDAPSSTKNQTKQRDPEMRSTKKGNNWYFGMKAHIGVDAESGLVHSIETTSANIHDSDKFEDCLHGEETALFADKGYFKDERKKQARTGNIFYGILDKAKR